MVPSLDPHIICLGTLYFVDWGLQSTRSQLIFSTTERSNLRQVTVGTFWLPLCHLENKNFQKKKIHQPWFVMIQIQMLVSHCDVVSINLPFLMLLLKLKGQVHCTQHHGVIANKIQSMWTDTVSHQWQTET